MLKLFDSAMIEYDGGKALTVNEALCELRDAIFELQEENQKLSNDIDRLIRNINLTL